MENHVAGGFLFGLAATVLATTAEAATLLADCNASPPDALGNALAMAAPFDVIEINGTCTQNVDILIDDLTIQGVGGGPTVAGQLAVNGARRVTIQGLALQGEGAPGPHGVSALNGAAVTILNVVIQKFVNGNGVHLEDGSRALLDQVTIQESESGVFAQSNAAVEITNMSVIEDNSGAGIELDLGSSGIVRGSTIQNNGSTGISVFRGSSAVLFDNTIQGNPEGISVNTHATAWLNGNTISNSGDEDALFIGWGSSVRMNGENTLKSEVSAIVLRQGATLNQRDGDVVSGPVTIDALSNAEFRNVSVTGNVEVVDHSLLRFQDQSDDPDNVSVTGNIAISLDSGLNFIGETPVKVVGNITCVGKESSLGTDTLAHSGVKKGCTGY